MRTITDSRQSEAPSEASNFNSTTCLVVADDAPGYTELLEEREDLLNRLERLEKSLVEANRMVSEIWGVVEDVAIGAKLECPTCKQNHPCQFDR